MLPLAANILKVEYTEKISLAPVQGWHANSRSTPYFTQDGGTHGHPWLIHVDVWQKPSKDFKVIILQLK